MAGLRAPAPEPRFDQLALFAGLGTAELAALRRAGTVRSFACGQTLFHQGDPADQLLLLLSGQVRVWRGSEDGVITTLHLLKRGALPGAVAMFRALPYPANATAVEEGQLLGWPADVVPQLIRDHPAFAINALALIGSHNEELLERVQELASAPVEVRVARALVRLADGAALVGPHGAIDLPLRRQDVAELATTTLHSVSRLVSRWEREGLLLGGRGRILIMDLPGLRRAAGGSW